MSNLNWKCPECGTEFPVDDDGYVKIQPLVSYYVKSACKLCGHKAQIEFNDVDDTDINVLEKMLKDAGEGIEPLPITYPNPRPTYPNPSPTPWYVRDICVYAGPTLPEDYWSKLTTSTTVKTSNSATTSLSTDGKDKPKDDRPTWD